MKTTDLWLTTYVESVIHRHEAKGDWQLICTSTRSDVETVLERILTDDKTLCSHLRVLVRLLVEAKLPKEGLSPKLVEAIDQGATWQITDAELAKLLASPIALIHAANVVTDSVSDHWHQ